MFFCLFHVIKGIYIVLRIMNLEEHQNSMIGSKVTMILMTFLVRTVQDSSAAVDNGEVSKGRSKAIFHSIAASICTSRDN